MPQWLEVVGRFHPLVLHLPIGLLIGLGVLELTALAQRRAVPTESGRLLALLAGIAAALAAATGLLLSQESGYTGDTVDLHQWLGIGVAVGAILVAILHRSKRRGPYLVTLVATLALLVPAGHFGGVMTHGEGFITEPLRPRRAAEAPSETTAPGSMFASVVAPILEAKCVSCHGPTKQKGGLALHTREGILKGGETGPALVVGKPAESELLRRIQLPLDDVDHMPPEGKPQPEPEEIRALEAWIAAGAPFEGSLTGAPSANVNPAAPATPAKSSGPPPAPPEALTALRQHLVHVEPLSVDSTLLWIDFAAAAQSTDSEVKALLEPLKQQVAELSLARSAITSEVATLLAVMPNLTRLDLRATAVTDEAVGILRTHPRLEELVLAQTRLTDGAIEPLLAMPALKRVHLWRSGVTPEGLKSAREQRPSLEINGGEQGPAAAVEVEPEIKLTSDAPVPGQAPQPASLDPINKACPVSGTPVDPKFAVVHKGRVIGFCCQNCPSQFWADPDKFEAALPK